MAASPGPFTVTAPSLIDAGHRPLVGRELHPARDVLGVAVREVRADQQRLLGADGEPRRRGKHFEARHRGIALRRRRRAGGDPVREHVILGRARREALAAAVRDRQRRFQQHQAGRRIDPVDAPRPRLPGQRQVVELGVVSAQRQLEPVLSGQRAVAGTRVAAGLREHRDDVIAEAHGVRCRRALDLDLRGEAARRRSFAVTMARPSPTALTTPDSSTVATAGLDEANVASSACAPTKRPSRRRSISSCWRAPCPRSTVRSGRMTSSPAGSGGGRREMARGTAAARKHAERGRDEERWES